MASNFLKFILCFGDIDSFLTDTPS